MGRVDDRFAEIRYEAMGARRSVLFDRLRLPAIGVFTVSKLRAKVAGGLLKALLRAVSSGTADRV